MSIVFLETSALLRSLFDEAGGDEVRQRLGSARRVLASRLLKIEAERAVLRMALDRPDVEKDLPLLQRELNRTWPHVDMIEMTREICDHAGSIAPRMRLRSLDAIHLATFQRAKLLAPEVTMLTFDQRLVDAPEDR